MQCKGKRQLGSIFIILIRCISLFEIDLQNNLGVVRRNSFWLNLIMTIGFYSPWGGLYEKAPKYLMLKIQAQSQFSLLPGKIRFLNAGSASVSLFQIWAPGESKENQVLIFHNTKGTRNCPWKVVPWATAHDLAISTEPGKISSSLWNLPGCVDLILCIVGRNRLNPQKAWVSNSLKGMNLIHYQIKYLIRDNWKMERQEQRCRCRRMTGKVEASHKWKHPMDEAHGRN